MATITGNDLPETINGIDAESDLIDAKGGNDTVNSLGGNDTIYGGDGDDALDGGAGNDYLDGQAGADTLIGGTGNDYLQGGLGADNLTGGDGDDTLVGYLNNYTDDLGVDILSAGAGNDELVGSIGDQFDGGAGNDILYLGLSTATVGATLDLNAATIGVTQALGNGGTAVNVEGATFYGGAGADVVAGHATLAIADYLSGGGGNDTLSGGAGNDQLLGGGGDDILSGGDGTDSLDGGDGNDAITGGAGNDSLYGGAGNDTLTAGVGNDSLQGGAGDDVYVWAVGDGNDNISDSGSGNDTISFTGIAQGDVRYWFGNTNLYVLHIGSNSLITVANQTYSSSYTIEQLSFAGGVTQAITALSSYTGSGFNDTMEGGANAETLNGLAGNDELYGVGGNDTLNGGTGNDFLYGGAGDDQYLWNVGDGNDTITDYDGTTGVGGTDELVFGAGITLANLTFAANSSGDLTVTYAPSNSTIRLVRFDDLATPNYQIERIRFADGSTLSLTSGFTLTGTASNETIYGTNFNDTISGAGGSDSLYGRGGNDALNGGAGNDFLYGGTGDDTYIVANGEGNDTISEYTGSGSGNDLLRMTGSARANVTLTIGSSDLTLTDATTGQRVVLDNQHYIRTAVVEKVEFSGGVFLDLTAGYSYSGTAVADTLYGGLFNDTINGLDGNDIVSARDGDDRLDGGAGNDTLNGEEGADRLFDTGGGNDTLNGGEGDDQLNGGAGNDALNGGAGAGDWAWYDGETQSVTVNLATQTASGGSIGTDTLSGIENAFGSLANDTLTGSALANTMNGSGGDDTVTGAAGDDVLLGGQGNDTVNGDDGADRLYGDEPFSPSQTSTAKGTLSTGGPLSISLTTARWDSGSSTPILGYVGSQGGDASNFNIVYVIDRSGSMSTSFSGNETVPDQNANGAANELIDGAIAGFTALHDSLIASGLGSANITVAPFDDPGSVIIYNGPADADLNANGIYDAIEALRTLYARGGTSFDVGLQEAIGALSARAGSNFVFFISDGEPNGGDYSDEVQTLINPLGLNATIRSIGLGNGASLPALDLVDDGLANNTAQRVLLPSQLQANLTAPTVDRSTIDRVEILVNGALAGTIAASALVSTPFGLRFDFTALGLSTTADDVITARVISAGPSPITVSTELTIGQADTTNGGNDIVNGGAGNDIIEGNAGDDTLNGGDGDDVLRGGAGYDLVHGGAGVDTADYSSEFLPVLAHLGWNWAGGLSIGQDVYTGIEALIGGAGSDVLITAAGANFASGGSGNDWIEDIGDGNDTLQGGDGNDIMLGGSGDDVVRGDAGDDALIGNAGNDRLTGGGGRDWAYGNDGDDLVDGGADVDVLFGDDGADQLLGGDGGDALIGGAGNDLLDGGAGVDWAYGGLGRDNVTGGAGDDVLFGGEGGGPNAANDIGDSLSGGAGIDSLIGEGGDDLLDGGADDDWVYGGIGNDTIIGGGGNDRLAGEEGADTITGGDGDDFVYGAFGDDVLDGGAGNDWIEGSFGNDVIYGGLGADSLFGGSGDVFVYKATAESTEAAADVIGIFWRPGGDKIDVSAVDADSNLNNGNGAFSFVSAFTNVAGQAVISFDGTNSVARFDTNGDAASDMTIVVLATQLQASDFIA